MAYPTVLPLNDTESNLMTRILIIISAMISSCIFSAGAQRFSEENARIWCDNNPLHEIEGIWEYPEDNARVLIQADKNVPGAFSLTVISTPDCRLSPGDVIGRLYPSVDSRQFRLEQWTRKDNLSLIKPHDCTATLSSDGESIRVKSAKLKFKINPNILLPRFWRIVRFSFNNPVDELPAGLVKIYPGYDHNGSLRRKIRIL